MTAYNVVVAPNGELFVTGHLRSAADFNGDGVTDLPAPQDPDGFIARFDSEGTLLGARAIGSPAGAPSFGPDGDLFLAGAGGHPIEQQFGPADFDGDGRADVEPSQSRSPPEGSAGVVDGGLRCFVTRS